MIRVVHPGSGSCFFTHPDPGSRAQKGTGSRIRIRNFALYRVRLKILGFFADFPKLICDNAYLATFIAYVYFRKILS
jgi:hypothetical protein